MQDPKRESSNPQSFPAAGMASPDLVTTPAALAARSDAPADSGPGEASSEPRDYAPTIALPKGGGAVAPMGERFSANAFTGTGGMSVPVLTTAARSLSPSLSLSYDSGAGNGAFGLGWQLSAASIKRKTALGLPEYRDDEESDTFMVSGSEDLVRVLDDSSGQWKLEDPIDTDVSQADVGYLIYRYRPRVESGFVRIERHVDKASGVTHWETWSSDNVRSIYGLSPSARVSEKDPSKADGASELRIFEWKLEAQVNDRGEAIVFVYKPEDDANVDLAAHVERTGPERNHAVYLKRIRYGNVAMYEAPDLTGMGTATCADPKAVVADVELADHWMFEVVFDYGEHDTDAADENQPWSMRPDAYSSFRPGFELRMRRACERVLMFHHIGSELGAFPLVASTEFDYQAPDGPYDPSVALQLFSVRHLRYDDSGQATAFPPVSFDYTRAVLDETVHPFAPEVLDNVPGGAEGQRYQFVDLDGEGAPGILSEQDGSFYYQPPMGGGRFERVRKLPGKPAQATLAGGAQFLDLDGDGQRSLVQLGGDAPGYYERSHCDENWAAYRPLPTVASIDLADPRVQSIDLSGDGRSDLLFDEGDRFVWYPSKGKQGFAAPRHVPKPADENHGPQLIYGDPLQRIFWADMTGDGLTDIVRVRNAEVCYWPGKGHGYFGHKVVMANVPAFAPSSEFRADRLRIGDVDGSGPSDLVYLGREGVAIYPNQAGNGLGTPAILRDLPPIDEISNLQLVDVMGSGTASLVWTTSNAGARGREMAYIDLMSAGKPYLLTHVDNHRGLLTRAAYVPSTRFYFEAKAAGTPWKTKLHFPVQVVHRTEVFDQNTRRRFGMIYNYAHGYFDGPEQEFRGFGRVDHIDTEVFGGDSMFDEFGQAENVEEGTYLPRVQTTTWFHLGGGCPQGSIAASFADEYWRESSDTSGSTDPEPLGDSVFVGQLTRDPGSSVWSDLPGSFDDGGRWALPGEHGEAMSPQEAREASRALRGSPLRVEIRALDGDEDDQASLELQRRPYAVSETNYSLFRVQPIDVNRYGSFLVVPRETIERGYDRYRHEGTQYDPRASHQLVLRVDRFGTPLTTVAISYPRRNVVAAGTEFEDRTTSAYVLSEQRVRHLDGPDGRRLAIPVQARSFELLGPDSPSDLTPVTFEQLRPMVDTVGYVPHEATPTPTIPKRLLSWTRNYYHTSHVGLSLDDDAPAIFEMSPRAIGYRTLTAVMSKNRADALLADSTGASTGVSAAALNDLLETQDGAAEVAAGYVGQAEGARIDASSVDYVTDHWWVPSGRVLLDETRFFLPSQGVDPMYRGSGQTPSFLSVYATEWDAYDSFPTKTIDPYGNEVVAEYDYRYMQARMVTDPNQSVTRVRFEGHGLVAAVAIAGPDGEGDPLDDPAEAPTMCYTYDLDAWMNGATPVKVSVETREQHATPFSDPDFTTPRDEQFGAENGLLRSVAYLDGGGGVVLQKVQAEDGPAYYRENGVLATEDVDEDEVLLRRDTSDRWVANGRTIVDNKGNPVRQYEPYFIEGEDFDDEDVLARLGVTAEMHYDPLGRVIKTDLPNGTFSIVEFTPWEVESYDPNDTVAESLWAQRRTPGDPEYDPNLEAEEVAALGKALPHANTSSTTLLDARGRSFRTIARPSSDPSEDIVTLQSYDFEGNVLSITTLEVTRQNPVSNADEVVDIVAQTADYVMGGLSLYSTSVDAGPRWQLPNVVGQPFRSWDRREDPEIRERRMTYDLLQRPKDLVQVVDGGAQELLTRMFYGEDMADPITGKHLGRPYQTYDGAGVATVERYDFKGNPLKSRRVLAKVDATTLEEGDRLQAKWTAFMGDGSSAEAMATAVVMAGVLEEEDAYIAESQAVYDGLNRVLSVVCPDGSRKEYGYNKAGMLEQVELVHAHADGGARVFVVSNVDHDEKGRRTRVVYGDGDSNSARRGTTTRYRYEPDTFRLSEIQSYKNDGNYSDTDYEARLPMPDGTGLQQLKYTYDPVGNIVHLRDYAQATVFSNNTAVEPANDYEYDAIYRLKRATGREHDSVCATPRGPKTPEVWQSNVLLSDGQALHEYEQSYEYDKLGNITKLRHATLGAPSQGDGCWTRYYRYAYDGCRLEKTWIGSGNEPGSPNYVHNAHGQMVTMEGVAEMVWDDFDQLAYTRDGSSHTWYQYDGSGMRVRKVSRTTGDLSVEAGTTKERVYFGEYELFRSFVSGDLSKETQTLHVSDDMGRMCLLDTELDYGGGSPPTVSVKWRYQLGNHLGSASLAVTEGGAVVSYEEYHPYGTTAYQAGDSETEVAARRYRYTGKEKDEETGLYYHGARYYAAWLGRWTAADPIGIGDGLNRFGYVGGNPVALADPSGTEGVDPLAQEAAPWDYEITYEADVRTALSEARTAYADATQDERSSIGEEIAIYEDLLGKKKLAPEEVDHMRSKSARRAKGQRHEATVAQIDAEKAKKARQAAKVIVAGTVAVGVGLLTGGLGSGAGAYVASALGLAEGTTAAAVVAGTTGGVVVGGLSGAAGEGTAELLDQAIHEEEIDFEKVQGAATRGGLIGAGTGGVGGGLFARFSSQARFSTAVAADAAEQAAARGRSAGASGWSDPSIPADYRSAQTLANSADDAARKLQARVDSTIDHGLPGVNFTHRAKYNPGLADDGLAVEGMGTNVGPSAFGSQRELVDTLIHEELHHRWWSRGNYGEHHTDRFFEVIDRFIQRLGL